MSDGSWEVQQAIVAMLAALDPPLAAHGVHSSAPRNQPLPFVEIGESDAVSADVQGRSGLDETFTVQVWAQFGSAQLVRSILSRIREALHGKRLTIPTRASASSFVGTTRVFPEADDSAMRGVLSLRIIHHGPEES
jgi:hypothetical protein